MTRRRPRRRDGLGKRYGRRWALRDCTFAVPPRRVVGLVGPNGAGKTTLLHLAVGLLEPTAGHDHACWARARPTDPAQLARVGFVAQENPLYARCRWPTTCGSGPGSTRAGTPTLAERRIDELGLDPKQRAGQLSGGQRAQLALTLAIAKRPELLVLDEPVASLDPLARREFLQRLMEAVADDEHERRALLAPGRRPRAGLRLPHRAGRFAGAARRRVDELLAAHHRLTGPRRDPATLPADQQVIEASHTDRQSTLLVRTDEPILDPAWTVEPVGLEDLVLAYMRRAGDADRARRASPREWSR